MFTRGTLIVITALLSLTAQAESGNFWPVCDLAIVNAKGETLSGTSLKISGPSYGDSASGVGADPVVHEGRLGELYARVEHFIGITSLTMELKRGSESLLVSLARVPTENNPQSFSKVKIAEGKWAMIECETQEYRW